jgi:DNA helicase-2/ATP-dependent DNA helicase PcrA
MDFDDLLLEFAWLLERDIDVRSYYQARYRHVLVDEFQDTNSAQYAIAKHLAAADNLRAARNLFAVGDEDQSIYSWRGADFRNVRRFRRDFPDALVVLLERNYRSTQNILDAARGVIDRNTERTEKKLWTDVGSGPKVTLFEAYNESEEAAYVVRRIQDLEATGERLGEIAVTYRTNAQSRAVEEVLVRNRIPYALIGGARFYERREVKDVLAYLRLVHNPADDVSFERIVNVPPRKIGASAQGMVRSWADAAGVTLAEALHALAGEDEPPDGATPVSTRARNALAEFDELLETLLKAREEYTVPDLVAFVLAKSGYAHWLRDGSEEGEERWENVREFRGVAEDFAAYEPREGLAAFLESVALVADVDSLDTSSDRVTLLTLHSAKGLEFSTVFITGVEEKVLPHSLSMDDPSAVEEERRLFYVGVTRARRRLYLLRTFRRSLYGASSGEVREPSRFLADIPESVLETAGAAVTGRAKPAAPDRTVWTTSRSRAAEADTSGETGFKAGDKVQHGTFGDGVVVSSRVTDGDEEVTVAFADIGVKKLLQSYARLEHR